jgi:acyl-CoA reductase-like NAD-dependent aldehyde dehydrogenase
VQEESFAPILVVQRAADWDEAMRLCNGVRQGLAAALFSDSMMLHERFLAEAQAGILKINSATANANAQAPFAGWKSSGIGPAEHGIANREFYTRIQAVYGA